jgi:CheY-like chemotaxis protein
LPRDHQGSESIEAIEEGALKAAGLTQQILNYSRLEASEQLAQVDVGNVLSGITVLLKSAIPASITLNAHPSEQPFVVLASEVNIAQILINLIINARDAVSGQGLIDISLVHELEQHEQERLFGPEPAAARYGAIQVSDNGCGMSEEVKARLFEPYFTTKNSAGTGLGLATVHSIVQQLGGVVECESQLGTGTTFTIALPLVDDPRMEHADSEGYSSDDTARGGGERILVVDDEDAVRNVLGLSLAHLGYEVETAASGREALEKFQAAQGSIRMVILDLLMPGLSGEDVFYRLREMEPNLNVLIVSGFSSSHVVERILSDGARDFIQKPFSIEVLSEKVRRCFGD